MKFALITLLLVIAVIGGSIGLAKNTQADYVLGQVVVLVKESNLGDQQIESILQQASPVHVENIKKAHSYDLVTSQQNYGKRLFLLTYAENVDVISLSKDLSKNSLILIAEPNYVYKFQSFPNDTLFPQQWELLKIAVPQAFDISMGKSDIIIAVIDTGVDLDHEDLADKLLTGWDFVDNDNITDDTSGHGTRVAGIVAAMTNNEIGIAGTCPNCKILPVRAGSSTTTLYWTINAIEYAVNNPDNIEGVPYNPNVADIISMSFGTYVNDQGLYIAIQSAHNLGALLIAAAGNDNTNQEFYPAAWPEVIAVGATNQSDERVTPGQYGWGSNYGSWVDVAAPGVNITTTDNNGGYTFTATGTSLSTPFVSGLVGLMLSRNPQLMQEEIRQVLIDTSDPTTGFSPSLGRINAYNALLEINRAPVLLPINNIYVDEGQYVVIYAYASDDDGDVINFSINDARFTKVDRPANGTMQRANFLWHTWYNDSGVYYFTVTASDIYGGVATREVRVSVANVSPPGKLLCTLVNIPDGPGD